jgi:hypothetical protein
MEPSEKRIKLFCQFHRASATAKFNNNLFSISVMHINIISILRGYREASDHVYLQLELPATIRNKAVNQLQLVSN